MKNYGFMMFTGIIFLLCSAVLPAGEKIPTEDNPLLNYVPADTLFFSGNSQVVSADDYALLNRSSSLGYYLNPTDRQSLGKERAFLYELYLELKKRPLLVYSIAEQPVLKMLLADKRVLFEVLKQAEKNTGMRTQQSRFAGQEYRFYPMGNEHQLIVVIQPQSDGKWLATLALLHNDTAAEAKSLIFGLTLPQQSVKRKIKKIQVDNQYLPVSVNFLDIKRFVQALYHNKQYLNNMLPQNLRTKACERDILALLDDVPELVGGYKQFDFKGQSISLHLEMLLKLKNKDLKTELSAFRGFIPQYIRQGGQENIVALGLGVDLSQISPFFIYLSQVMRQNRFQCAPLKALQYEIAQLNPLSLAMMSGAVDGIHGISFALQEFSVMPQRQGQDSAFELSAIISLSAEHPLKVWQMIAALSPQAALMKADKTAVKFNFPELDALGIEVFLAVKAQHLVLYTGTKAQEVSNHLQQERIVKNGLFQQSMNFTKAAQAVKDLRQLMTSESVLMVQQPLAAETCLYLDESITTLSEISGWVDYQNDFTALGWLHILAADIHFNTLEPASYTLPGKYFVYSVQDGCLLARDGVEQLFSDGTGIYQQYAQDEQCFIAEVRYNWQQQGEQLKLQYVIKRSRPEGLCSNAFSDWVVPEAEFINDSCLLRKESGSEFSFSCLYQWDGILNKSVYSATTGEFTDAH